MYGKKIEIVYDNKRLISRRIGYSLGTVYTINPFEEQRFELFNVGYLPSTKEYYYNKNVHLPKSLVEYFESKFTSREKLEQEMRYYGIYRKDEIDMLIEDHYNEQVQSKGNILSLKRFFK